MLKVQISKGTQKYNDPHSQVAGGLIAAMLPNCKTGAEKNKVDLLWNSTKQCLPLYAVDKGLSRFTADEQRLTLPLMRHLMGRTGEKSERVWTWRHFGLAHSIERLAH